VRVREPRDRLARVELELDRLRPSLHERIEKLEKAAGEPKPKGWARFFSRLGAVVTPLLGPLAILVVGYFLKDSIDLAIKQQQLQLSYAKEIKEPLDTMAKRDAGLEDVKRAALLVAGFGRPAVLPLMNELRQGGNRTLGAEAGLVALAFTQPEAVCDPIRRILESPARPLTWEGQMVSARILAAANCGAVSGVLRRHREALKAAAGGDWAALDSIVKVRPEVRQRKDWLEAVEQAISELES
jgi:hypothetical protein